MPKMINLILTLAVSFMVSFRYFDATHDSSGTGISAKSTPHGSLFHVLSSLRGTGLPIGQNQQGLWKTHQPKSPPCDSHSQECHRGHWVITRRSRPALQLANIPNNKNRRQACHPSLQFPEVDGRDRAMNGGIYERFEIKPLITLTSPPSASVSCTYFLM